MPARPTFRAIHTPNQIRWMYTNRIEPATEVMLSAV